MEGKKGKKTEKSYQHFMFNDGHTETRTDRFLDLDMAGKAKLKEIVQRALLPEGARVVDNIVFKVEEEDGIYIGTLYSRVNGVDVPLLMTSGAKDEEAGKRLWASLQERLHWNEDVIAMAQRRPCAPFAADLIYYCLPDEYAVKFVFSGMCGAFCKYIGWAFLFPEVLGENGGNTGEDGGVKPSDEVAISQSMTGLASRDEMISRAARNMEMLGFTQDAIDRFRESGKLDSAMEDGRLVPLGESDQRLIQDYEDRYGGLAYAAIRSDMGFGRLINYLVVSPYKEDWLLERTFIENGCVPAYAYNYDVPSNSESGTIGIMRLPGGMFRRTW